MVHILKLSVVEMRCAESIIISLYRPNLIRITLQLFMKFYSLVSVLELGCILTSITRSSDIIVIIVNVDLQSQVTFNGKVPYEDDTEGSQMQSITNEAVANNINDIVDDDHLNEQPNITHSCVSDDLLPDRTGPCQPSSSLAAVSSHLDIGVVTRTVNVHMTDPSSSFASKVPAGASDTHAHAIKVTNKRKRRSKRSSKVEDDPELDLNLKSIEENYQEICRLLVSFSHIAFPIRYISSIYVLFMDLILSLSVLAWAVVSFRWMSGIDTGVIRYADDRTINSHASH